MVYGDKYYALRIADMGARTAHFALRTQRRRQRRKRNIKVIVETRFHAVQVAVRRPVAQHR